MSPDDLAPLTRACRVCCGTNYIQYSRPAQAGFMPCPMCREATEGVYVVRVRVPIADGRQADHEQGRSLRDCGAALDRAAHAAATITRLGSWADTVWVRAVYVPHLGIPVVVAEIAVECLRWALPLD